jgi:hypothetical protein
MPGRDDARWRAAQQKELEEAKARSDSLTLSERMGEAWQWYLHTVAEIARRARDREHFDKMMDEGNEPFSLRARWEAIQAKKRR